MIPNDGNSLHLNRQILITQYPELYDENALYLTNSTINAIDPATFNGLTKLKALRLYFNQLTTLDPATFNGLIMLEELGLSDNQLTSIYSTLFNGLIKLRYLNLNNSFIVNDSKLHLSVNK